MRTRSIGLLLIAVMVIAGWSSEPEGNAGATEAEAVPMYRPPKESL